MFIYISLFSHTLRIEYESTRIIYWLQWIHPYFILPVLHQNTCMPFTLYAIYRQHALMLYVVAGLSFCLIYWEFLQWFYDSHIMVSLHWFILPGMIIALLHMLQAEMILRSNSVGMYERDRITWSTILTRYQAKMIIFKLLGQFNACGSILTTAEHLFDLPEL